MSYLRILDDVDMEGLRQLVHSGLIKPASQAALHQTSLCIRVALEGERYKRGNNIYELRISKSFVRGLIEKATHSFDPHTSLKISLLYRTGLGLPLNKECHLLWEVIASGSSPKVNGRIFSYKDMLKVLVAHWKQIAADNLDPYWLYFNPQNDYFKSLLDKSYPTVIKPDYIKEKKPLYVFPRYEGMDCSLIYRLDPTGRAVFYAAFARINQKLLNVTVQVLMSKSVITALPENSIPNSFGPFLIVSGVLTIKRSNQKLLRKEWGNIDVTRLIRSGLEQDTMPLQVYRDIKLDSSDPSVVFTRTYKASYSKAVKYLHEAKSKRLTKKVAERINKAQKLVDRFNEHKELIDASKEENERTKEFDVLNYLEFIAFDVYGYRDARLRKFTNPYQAVHVFMQGLGFNTSKLEPTRAKTVNKLQQHAKDYALKNFTHNGIVCRVSENGSNDPLTWVKFKFQN